MQIGGFKITWVTVLVAMVSLGLGAYLNYLSNLKSNEKLFAQIKDELDKLKEKQQAGRITADENTKINQLEAQLSVLSKQI